MKTEKTKRTYTPPTIRKAQKMTFPVEVLTSNGTHVVCRQCSSCHGCR